MTVVDPAGPVYAFDIGPANALVDAVVARTGADANGYDTGGRLAAAGQVHDGLLAELLDDAYYDLPAPKSTGKEHFHGDYVDAARRARRRRPGRQRPGRHADRADRAHGRRDVAAAGVSTLVVSGGGCHNPVVMAGLRAALPGVGVMTSDDLGVPADTKEAIAFAILGWCTAARPARERARGHGRQRTTGPRNDHARSPAAAAAGARRDAGAEPADGRSRMVTVTLRDARPDDLDGIVAVFLGCWHVTYAETLPAATVAAMTTAGARALWSRVLGEGAPGEVIVARARRADGETAIAGVTRWSPSGWVHSLYVDPAAQGTGVGSLLLAEATRRIGRAGAATAHLWVFRDNAAGRRFYGRHGWSPDGTTRVEEEFGAPELRLTRPLERPPRTERSADGPLTDLVTGLVDATVVTPSGGTPPAGLAVAVCTEHGGAHAVAGRRSVDTATTTAAPLTVDTLHDLASVTKVVATTTAVLALVSAGQLALDDPAVRYLPGFGDGAKATITVRDLLTHRAGLWEWHPLYAVAAGDPAAADAFVDRLDLRYPPRQARHYSDLGFVQLGRIVAAVAGQPLDRAVAQLVTEPLGLVRTTFATPAGPLAAMSAFGDDVERAMLATGSPYPVPYGPDDFTGWRDRAVLGAVNDGNAFHAYGGVAGHAGLFSDLADMIRFALAVAEPGAHAASWRPDVVAEFVAPGPDPAQALGFRRYPIELAGRSTTLVGHTGFVGCAVGFVPGRPIAVAMASNRLVTPGPPVPIDELWTAVLEGAAAWITEHS